jgi:hypothetical protein
VILGLLPFACTEAPEPLQGPSAPTSGLLTSALDGDETLGDPKIAIAEGTGIVVAGIGLRDEGLGQPGTINVTLPSGVTVKQILIYWEGHNPTAVGDPNILVDSSPVAGTEIGGPNFFFGDAYSTTYRADITGDVTLTPGGTTAVVVDGLDFEKNNGAGILVIFDDGTRAWDIGVKDGNDLAYHGFPDPRKETIPQTFTFLPATVARQADVCLMASSVQEDRPNIVRFTFDVGGTLDECQWFNNTDDRDFDAVCKQVTVPANATSMTIECISAACGGNTNDPASLAWLCAAVAVQPQLAAIGDYVWHDEDQDGCQGATEDPVNGVTVKLYSCDNPSSPVLMGTQITGQAPFPAGEYFFDNLTPGDYFVEFSNLPTGYQFTAKNATCTPGGSVADSDADLTTGRTMCTTLTPGEIDRTWDAGIFTEGTFGDKVWLDGNCDGCQDPDEPGIDGVTVKLYNCDTPSSPVLVSTVTTGPPTFAAGGYLFEHLPPGDYFVEFSGLPAGHAFTTPNDCAQGDEKDSDADPSTGRTACVTLPPGGTDLSWDAGLIELLSIGDYVWRDDDRDGCQGDLEIGVAGVTVHLWQGSSLVGTETTDAAGMYLFENLMPGSYKVQFVLPSSLADHNFTVKDAACSPGGDEKDSDADPLSGMTDVFELVCGQDDMTIDAGIIPPVIGCRMTGGCNDTFDTGQGTEVYTCGGQAGAPLATQPQPWGEWTHTQKRGPSGSFTFHAGTASAPPGTEIDWIECMDPDWCRQARHAPAKQIDFAGVGTFKNIKNCPPEIENYVIVDESMHWFEVNVDDLGEPGKAGKVDPPAETCDPMGFGRNGGTELADCECPDFYRITIHQGSSESSPILYEVYGYIDGGNFQIHPLTGRDRKNVENDGKGGGKR